MILCEMTGCYDSAEFSAEFDTDEETKEETIFDICESCADYWSNHKEESPKITAWKITEGKK
jgi:hypothetical protein